MTVTDPTRSRAVHGLLRLMVIAGLALAVVTSRATAQEGEEAVELSGRRTATGGCVNPDEEIGSCIPVTQCPPLVALLRQRPVPLESVQFLRNSQCGFQANLPLVCCPNTVTRQPNRPNRPANPRPTSRPRPNNNQVWPSPAATTSRPKPPPQRNPSQEPASGKLRLLPTQDCGRDLTQRIFGGNQSDLGEFPWMALLQYRNSRGGLGFYCGGVLISKRYVLTAAHCIAEDSVKLVSVRLGEHDTKTSPDCIPDLAGEPGAQICADPAVDVPVEREIPYPEYRKTDSNHYNDIALLRLARDVPFSDYVQPICLPVKNDIATKSYVGKRLWVAGWGKTETRSESDVKLKLAVPVVANKDCAPVYQRAYVRLSDNSQMCAGGETGRDSCNGDSGGPLMSADNDNGDIRWHVTGVVAFGPVKCGMKDWPGVYTRVAHFVPWILENIE